MRTLDSAGCRSATRTPGDVESIGVFLRDTGHGMLEVSHNSLALLGLILVAALLFVGGQRDLRHELEAQTLTGCRNARSRARPNRRWRRNWSNRMQSCAQPPPTRRNSIVSRPPSRSGCPAATASPPSRSAGSCRKPGTWARKAGLDPMLILAIMAVESSFNPFAQSSVGAQGLMQVMTKVHDEKYTAFGGVHAAFDPVTNLRVGVQVLKECIARAGGLEAGLRFYVGAANLVDDGGYAVKVLSEQNNLRQVASGRSRADNGPRAGDPAQVDGTGRGRRRLRCPPRPPSRRARSIRSSSPSSADAAARPLRYTGRAARLAMGLRPRARGGSPPGSAAGVALSASVSRSPGQPDPARTVLAAGSLQRTATCSTVRIPPLPPSTPRSGRRSSKRTGARKITSS